MKKNEKKTQISAEEFVLKIEIAEESSEMIMKLEKIMQQDKISHKLPTDFDKSIKTSDDKD